MWSSATLELGHPGVTEVQGGHRVACECACDIYGQTACTGNLGRSSWAPFSQRIKNHAPTLLP